MSEITETPELLDTLYRGWLEYRKRIKGYCSSPSLTDIQDWEQFKAVIVKAVKENNGTQTRLEDSQDS
jgi:hypothetical protein